MKNLLLAILIMALLVIGALKGSLYIYDKSQTIMYTELPAPHEVEVSKGDNFSNLLSKLNAASVVPESDNFMVKLWIKLNPDFTKIKAGIYTIDKNDNLVSLLTKITKGQEKLTKVKLIEGKTLKEWGVELAKVKGLNFKPDVFNKILKDNNDLSNLPEGKFYPDTYAFGTGDDAYKILTISYKRMQKELDRAWNERDLNLPLESAYQMLILASIVEKETGKAEERPLIASVFINRLKKGMKLQTDPTIIYGMGDSYNGVIKKSDILKATPFNTYVIFGLPPTPISTVSIASLDAVSHPATTNYLYFVSKNNGTHTFSENYAEHVKAVNKYQRGK